MLARRIVPCLDVKDGRTVKGVHFVDLVDAGDPVELAAAYAASGADEVVFLDITATTDKRATVVDLAARVGRVLDVPFTIGGGIRTVDDARAVLQAGADKVAVNSAALARPAVLGEIADALGRQAVMLAVDAARRDPADPAAGWTVRSHGGRRETGRDAVAWAAEGGALGAGEILLTSIDGDGTRAGYDLALLRAARAAVSVPLIASGGAGTAGHVADALEVADAALLASILHDGTLTVPDLKAAVAARGLPVRPC